MGALTPPGAVGPQAGLGFGGLPTGVRAVIALLVIGSLVEFYRAGLAFVRAAVGVVVKDPSISAAANLVDGIVTLVLAVVILGLARALARGNRRARVVVIAFLVLPAGRERARPLRRRLAAVGHRHDRAHRGPDRDARPGPRPRLVQPALTSPRMRRVPFRGNAEGGALRRTVR